MNFYHAVSANKSRVATALPAQLSYLNCWRDPADASVGDTTIDDKTYNAYGAYSSYDNFLSGSNGAAVVDLSGTKCMYLDGVNDRAYTQNARISGVDIWKGAGTVDTFTEEMWIRSNGSWVSQGNFINTGYNNAWRVRTNSNGTLWNYFTGQSFTAPALATNTWHHMVWSVEGNGTNYVTCRIYRNSSLFQTFTINRNPSYCCAVHFYGGYSSTSEPQRMYIGVTRRYEDRALTAAEVLNNYNLEKANYGY